MGEIRVAMGLALALLAPAVWGDLVVFNDGLSLECKVRKVGEDRVVVSVYYGEWGEVVIPRERIKLIEYDIESRRKAIKSGDLAGQFALGKWAFQQGLHEEALKTLLPLVGKEGVSPEIHGLLLRIYESRDEPEKALEQVDVLLKRNPGDKALKAKREAIARALGLKAQAGAAPAPTGGAKNGAAKGGEPKPKAPGATAPAPRKPARTAAEGLERMGWRHENWGNPCEIRPHKDPDGNIMLAVTIPANGGKDKAAIAMGFRQDLTGKKALRMSIYNGDPKQSVNIALAIVTQAGYFESMHKTIRPDWNMDVSLDLVSDRWKCAKSNWAFKSRIEKPETVNKIVLLVYNGRRETHLFFDDLRVE